MQISAAQTEPSVATSIATSIAPWAEAARNTSHSVAQILARPSFAVAHKSPSSAKPGGSTDVADASSPAVAMRSADAGDQAGDAPPADAGPAPRAAAARDPAWDDRNEGLKDAIAYLDLAPKYPAAHIESPVAPFGFAHNSTARNTAVQINSAQNSNARNSNAQNSIPLNGAALNSVVPSRRVERAGNSALGPKQFRMPPPPHAEIPMMMPEPRPPRLTAVQDISRQESPGSSFMR